MATSVQVLCPNGHRQNVKVNPNTKLLQVLEEVCSKQGFLPPDEYNLVHGRIPVDLSLAFRFSNLPNNAKLELTKTSKQRAQAQMEVTIALQLENGDRLQHAFHPSASLWDILNHWESQEGGNQYDVNKDNLALQGAVLKSEAEINMVDNVQLTKIDTSQTPPIHPVCIYMHEEVIGEDALRNVTLKTLALTSGKAVIRLVHRPVDDSTLAEILGRIEKEKAKQSTLEALAENADTRDQPSPIASKLVSCDENSLIESDVDGRQEPVDTQVTAGSEIPSSMPSSRNEETSEQPVSAVRLEHPRSEDNERQSALEELRRMNIPGLEIITPADFNNLSPEEQQTAQRLAQQAVPELFSKPKPQDGSKPKSEKLQPTSGHSFANFKFPEETKGKHVYRNELSDVKEEEFKPCDREAVVFNSNEERSSKAIPQDVGDDFFELTEADIRSLMRDLQRQVSSMTDRPLLTESMRQAEAEQKYQQYDMVVLRIQFPDGLVLQGCFRPRETVFSVYKFVKEYLQDVNQEFYLYTSPPRHFLSDMAASLVQADLAPASVIYFGSSKPQDHWLSESVQAGIISKLHADELSVKKMAKKTIETMATRASAESLHLPTSDPAGSVSEGENNTPSTRPHVAAARATRGSEAAAKMPKWLKLGK